jgi:hypothetical protein
VPATIFGLPLHPLVVHATVVVVPLAALLLIASAVSGRVRRWAGWLTPAVAAVALVLVPLSTSTGENLEGAVGESPLVETHAELADQLLPWAIGMVVLAFALVWLDRREPSQSGTTGRDGGRDGAGRDGVRRAGGSPAGTNRALAVAVTVLAVVAGLGTGVQVVRIGHSGAKAVWSKQIASGHQGGEKQGDDH